MRRSSLILGFVLALSLATAVALAALADARPARSFPVSIPLPNGFQPEGISIRGTTFYVGSIPTGAVVRGSLVTGKTRPLVAGGEGRAAIGLQVVGRRLFVAGGSTGRAFVYDARTGAPLASYQLASGDSFVNDVVVTRTAAFFTDSVNQVLYRLVFGRGGTLPPAAGVQQLPLTGDIKYVDGFNANGIDATPNGKTLVLVQSNVGLLFRVDSRTGATSEIKLSGGNVRNGDGILLDGKLLYVVQNRNNQIAVIRLAPNLRAGTIVRTITSTRFQVPTTIDEHGRFLYAVNARFGTEPTPQTPYNVVRVRKLR